MALGAYIFAQPIPDTWWNNAVFYEIFVRSYNDSDGDGIGDFQGIIQKLDHLNDGDPATTDDLGVNAIWLMPINPSPSYHGYDVTDYFGINPDYGTLTDFQQLITECDNRGIKVIMDFVGNHSSSQHPHFIDSSSGPSSTYRDYYVWSDTDPGGGWHFDNGAWYYGLFWSGMPDWNVVNQDVVDYHYSIVDFWLAQGVSGFRYDAVKHLVEENGQNENTPGTFDYLYNFYNHYKSVDPEAICVGEAWTSTPIIADYGPPFTDFCFEFGLSGGIISAVNNQNPADFSNALQLVIDEHQAGAYAPFLSNHDQDRVYSQLGTDDDKMKLASALYLTLPGVPFIYYGEEIGMTGTGADPNKRTPMQWADGWQGGFTSGTPWAAVQPDIATQNVDVQNTDANSLLAHYREFVQLRQSESTLRTGEVEILTSSSGDVVAYLRSVAGESILVVHNLSGSTVTGSSVTFGGLCQSDYTVTDLRDGTNFGISSLMSGSTWNLPENLTAFSSEVYKLEAGTVGGCTVDLTLSVDMAGETVDPSGVMIEGSFNGWTGPVSMTENGSVWTTTLSVDVGSTVQYRFMNGTTAEVVNLSCTVNDPSQGDVREIVTGVSDQSAPVVCFGECEGCYFGPVTVTFMVNLEGAVPAPEGLHIAGTFQGWDPGLTPMTNVFENIWSYSQTFEPGTWIEFKYINGDQWGEDETVPEECAAGWNRFHTVGTLDETVGPVCFGTCDFCPGTETVGCTDSTACNYDSSATADDGSCDFSCYGCTNSGACNFDPGATIDDASCDFGCLGCTDSIACNYDSSSTIDDGSCDFSCYGCTDSLSCNFDSSATVDNGGCDYTCFGCTDPGACNFDSASTMDDASCDYSCLGCTNSEACNFDPQATIDSGTCILGGDFCGEGTVWDSLSATCVAISPETCFGDLDGDGAISTPDLLTLLTVFGTLCP